MSLSHRCLIAECMWYHWEVLPPWVTMLNRLGYEVEIATSSDSTGHVETLELLGARCRTHRLADLPSLSRDRFDFVVLNTLIHEGYVLDRPPDPRPDLKWLRDLGRPSISVVHEPRFWVEKRIVKSFRQTGVQGDKQFNLLADGYIQDERGTWLTEQWALEGNRLLLSAEGRQRIYESSGDGRSFLGVGADEGTMLRSRDRVSEDLSSHCADGRHAVVTPTPAGAAHLRAVLPGADWIIPFEMQDRLPSRGTGAIAFAGAIDYDRKQLASLLDGAAVLLEGRFIRIIGGSRSADFEGDRFVASFKGNIAKRGLESKFQFTGYLRYGEFIDAMRDCRFLLPLVDDLIDSGQYLIKLSASVAASFALGVPLIVNEKIAEKFDLQYMICYRDLDLASGIEAEQQLSGAQYAAMLQMLDRQAEALDRRNIETLGTLIERITTADHGGEGMG